MASQGSGLKIDIKKYRAAGFWRWDIEELGASRDDAVINRGGGGVVRENKGAVPTYLNKDDEEEETLCGICHAHLDGTCPTCVVPGDDCPPVLGACSHTFHMHCIVKWLAPDSRNADERRQHCPMCRAEWKFKGERD